MHVIELSPDVVASTDDIDVAIGGFADYQRGRDV